MANVGMGGKRRDELHVVHSALYVSLKSYSPRNYGHELLRQFQTVPNRGAELRVPCLNQTWRAISLQRAIGGFIVREKLGHTEPIRDSTQWPSASFSTKTEDELTVLSYICNFM